MLHRDPRPGFYSAKLESRLSWCATILGQIARRNGPSLRTLKSTTAVSKTLDKGGRTVLLRMNLCNMCRNTESNHVFHALLPFVELHKCHKGSYSTVETYVGQTTQFLLGFQEVKTG